MLISDLYEGGVRERDAGPGGRHGRGGVQVVALLALSDDGAPAYDTGNAAALAALGVPAFACTPDAFPDLLARRHRAAATSAAGPSATSCPAANGHRQGDALAGPPPASRARTP